MEGSPWVPFSGKCVGPVTGREAVSREDPLLDKTPRTAGGHPWTSALLKRFAILSACVGEGLAEVLLDNSES